MARRSSWEFMVSAAALVGVFCAGCNNRVSGTGGSGQGGAGNGSGGVSGSGGGNAGSGGSSTTGGSTGSGGSGATGGSTGSGGNSATGGSKATGGSVGSGGNTTAQGGSGGTNSGRDAAAGSQDAQQTGDSASSTGDAGCVPNYSCKPTSPNTGDPYADCVARVNQFRACVCLPALPRWSAGEACADQDAQYDSQQNSAHAGFIAGICASGNAQDECPDWSTAESVIDVCLQEMFDEGPPPTATCTGTCYSAHGHYINMTGTDYKSGVACGFYTTSSGGIWAAQNFQ